MKDSKQKEIRTGEKYFASLGAGYETEAFSGLGPAWISDRELNAVRTALRGMPKGAQVLDAGAGNGRATKVMGDELGLDVTALDAVPEMLASILEERPSTKTVFARLGVPLPFDSETFDAVISLRVLKWVPAWEHALTELARVLRPTGRIAVEITNRRSIARFGYRNAAVIPVTRSAARDVGERAGIEWIDEIPGTHLPLVIWRMGKGNTSMRLLTGSQAIADHVLGSTGARSVVLVGRKK